MLFLEPVTGSFAVYAHRYMSPFFGYLTALVILVYVDGGRNPRSTAIGVYVQFWFPEMARWILGADCPAVGLVALTAFGCGAPVW